ncbi:MAG: hypothetical protein ACC619_03685, partial [Paracoccaceae bacterium]
CRADWETYHLLALSAVFHLLAGNFAGGLFASDFTYLEDRQMLHWGTNSVTNAMLSSGNFSLEPRGAETARSQKIKAVYEFGLMDQVNVCWAGPRTGENCGKCTKCRRAMLMAFAQDLDPQLAFPRLPGLWDVIRVPVHSPVALTFSKDLADCWSTRRAPFMYAILRIRLALQPIEALAFKVARSMYSVVKRRAQ